MLTPLGRGQALLVTGMRQSGKTSLVLDAILGQYRSGVRCIYAAIGQRYCIYYPLLPLAPFRYLRTALLIVKQNVALPTSLGRPAADGPQAPRA